MAELLKMLSETNGVSGNENDVRELILGEIREKCDDITIDTMGNIIALKKGKAHGKTIAVTAYMDEPGLIVSHITDNGYIKFKSVGNIDPRKLVSKKVVIDGKTKGVIGMKAIHLQTADERKTVVKVKDLYIDIGAGDRDDALKRVKYGDYITFDTEFEVIGKNIKGKALDRSGPCYALTNALSGDYPYDFYACFLTQHEVGARGAKIAASRVKPDAILTISTADTADMYKCEKNEGGLEMGCGMVLSLADKAVLTDRRISDYMLDAAAEKGIKAVPKVTYPYKSDGGELQAVDARVISAVIPCRYSRSPVSLMSMEDIKETEAFIRLYLNKISDALE